MLSSTRRPCGSSSMPSAPVFVVSAVYGLEPTEGDDVGRRSPLSATLSPALPRDPGREEELLPRDIGRAGGRPPRESLRERADCWLLSRFKGVLKGGLVLPHSEMVPMLVSAGANQVEAEAAVVDRLPLVRSGQTVLMLSTNISERISTPPTFPK